MSCIGTLLLSLPPQTPHRPIFGRKGPPFFLPPPPTFPPLYFTLSQGWENGWRRRWKKKRVFSVVVCPCKGGAPSFLSTLLGFSKKAEEEEATIVLFRGGEEGAGDRKGDRTGKGELGNRSRRGRGKENFSLCLHSCSFLAATATEEKGRGGKSREGGKRGGGGGRHRSRGRGGRLNDCSSGGGGEEERGKEKEELLLLLLRIPDFCECAASAASAALPTRRGRKRQRRRRTTTPLSPPHSRFCAPSWCSYTSGKREGGGEGATATLSLVCVCVCCICL